MFFPSTPAFREQEANRVIGNYKKLKTVGTFFTTENVVNLITSPIPCPPLVVSRAQKKTKNYQLSVETFPPNVVYIRNIDDFRGKLLARKFSRTCFYSPPSARYAYISEISYVIVFL